MPVRKPISDINRFCQVLLASGLVSDIVLSDVRAAFHSKATRDSMHGATLTAFAADLVARGIITSWQCGKLRRGQYKGFFFEGYKLLGHLGDDDRCNRYLAEDCRTAKCVVLCVIPPLIAPMKDRHLEYWVEDYDS